MSIELFGGIVARYALKPDEWQHCCLTQNASLCRQRHGHGWIARRKDDGKEVFVGKDCAHQHFGANSSFATEAKRITNELALDDLIRRFNERANDPAFATRLTAAQQKQQALKGQFESARRSWPATLLLRLSNMAKTGNRRVGIFVVYVETDKETKKTTRTNVAASLGDIVAPGALELAPLSAIYQDLSAAASSLRDAAVSRDMPRKQLKARVAALELLDRAEPLLAELEAGFGRFNSPDNLLLLPWTMRNDDRRRETAANALRIALARPVSETEVSKWLNDRARAIREAHDGREFHIDA